MKISLFFYSFYLTHYLEDTFAEDSLTNNSSIGNKVIDNSTIINSPKKYMTDEEDYTLIESIAFSIRTNQQKSKSNTVLAGINYDNISYSFNIEVRVSEIVISFSFYKNLSLGWINENYFLSK